MSILRQLLISVTLAIGIVLLGTLVLSVTSARSYLNDQLKVQSEDGATSLALTLSQPANNNPVTQELLISAIFDSGHFELVRLEDPQGTPLIERRNTDIQVNTPAWFRQLVPVSVQAATRGVSDGWTQIGSVTLVANAAYALETLWRNSLRLVMLAIIAGLLWALFAVALVRWLELRLLREVSEQVRALGTGGFKGEARPRVREFSAVAEAVNETRDVIKATAVEHNAKIELLTLELNRDPVTGLANRKYFVNEFRRALTPGGGNHQGRGHLILFRQRDLAAINRHMPRDFTDQWLRSVGERTTKLLQWLNAGQHVLARLNGSDFAVLLPGIEAPQATMIAERIRLELRSARIPVGEGALCRWALAVADFTPDQSAGNVLAELDHALMQSESAGEDTVIITQDVFHVRPGTGEYAWKDAILTALEQHRFSLTTEPIRSIDGKVVREEATLVLHSDGSPEPIPATLFIPPAVRLGLAAECDIQAARLGLDWLVSNPTLSLTVRLSLPSLAQPRFLERLDAMLADRHDLTERLFLEVDAHGLVEQHDLVCRLAVDAQKHGVRIGLRRLAQQFGALTQLHTLPLNYLKLGGGFVSTMTQSPGSQLLTASVIETAKPLGIEVYAEDVPDRETQEILASLGVRVMRGPGVATATIT
ncbi:LapD/MoxY N-terminal periplasmic domain-containing protein [Alcaligenaceae bacterium C4P045]|nr:LapD/MoxY N-terminal periplasmic domain-containing protein [Alcaligenaceae bacterium B3P038]MDQ2147080.1 LapD/MoxY N-terminal periplasmic domain-containing protein [Alcaligenaceae bacterium C4P045]